MVKRYMKRFKTMIIISMAALAMAGCTDNKKENTEEKFTYIVDEFADLKISDSRLGLSEFQQQSLPLLHK